MDIKSFIVKGDEIYVGTWFLSKGFKVEHRALKRLINRYKSEFEELGVVVLATQQPTSKKGGHPIEEFILNKLHFIYLISLLSNNKSVRLAKQFFVTKCNQFEMNEIIDGKLIRSFPRRKGHIYIIEDNNEFLKIGRSVEPEKRIAELTTQGNLSITNQFISSAFTSYYKIETCLHNHFSKHLVKGEWFNVPFLDAVKKILEITEAFSDARGKCPPKEAISSFALKGLETKGG